MMEIPTLVRRYFYIKYTFCTDDPKSLYWIRPTWCCSFAVTLTDGLSWAIFIINVVCFVGGSTHVLITSSKHDNNMMTSSNVNIFRVTGPFCGEFTGPYEFLTQRPVTRSFDVFFDLRLKKRLSKQPWGWRCETPSWSLWRQCNENRNVPNCAVQDMIMLLSIQYTPTWTHTIHTLTVIIISVKSPWLAQGVLLQRHISTFNNNF